MRKFILFIILFWFFSVNVLAQAFSRYKYEFYYGIGGTNLMADVCAPSDANKLAWVNLLNTIGFVGNTGLRYRLSEKQSASVNLSLGKLHAEDPMDDPKYWAAGRATNTFFTEVSARYELMVVKEQKKKTVYRMLGESYFKNLSIPIYLFIGAGGLYNKGKFSRTFAENDSISTTPYSNLSLIIPYGIGFKTRVTNTSYINLEVGLRFAFSDRIDNWENGWYDQYQFITINYIIKLKANKNGMPVIRTLFF
ncbi:MAG: DUF6089 family protein [Salinivirgaceae bacterium]